ncbi:MAG: hypothetical protein ACD_19C00017G0007 [uncultured bacterium]|nr:MAG: hypothetical protein ACD_19C00017G0007 [uncultured bacterium]
MKGEAVRNLKLAKKQVEEVITQIEKDNDWKNIHKNIIQIIKLIKSATRKFIIFNMLKKRNPDEILKLYKYVN